MPEKNLNVSQSHSFQHGRMVLGFSGWMDGGEVSTGVIETLAQARTARLAAIIEPHEFYIYNFPGSMEISALFRPHVHIDNGLLVRYQEPQNLCFLDEPNELLFFIGKEPHLHWHEYTKAFFDLVDLFNVKEIYFVGSVAGLTPHTRDPHITATVSQASFKEKLNVLQTRFTFYDGPGSIVNLFLKTAAERGLDMATLVAETPAYVQGRNPRCIEALIRRLAALLAVDIDLADLRADADQLEIKINDAIEDRPELATHIQKLEENYDQEIFDTEMGDLKDWLQQQGIRLD